MTHLLRKSVHSNILNSGLTLNFLLSPTLILSNTFMVAHFIVQSVVLHFKSGKELFHSFYFLSLNVLTMLIGTLLTLILSRFIRYLILNIELFLDVLIELTIVQCKNLLIGWILNLEGYFTGFCSFRNVFILIVPLIWNSFWFHIDPHIHSVICNASFFLCSQNFQKIWHKVSNTELHLTGIIIL